MANSREIIQSQKYKETHGSFDELMQMMDDNSKEGYDKAVRLTLNPQLHSRSATYIKRNGLLIRKITIKSSRPFQCAYHPLTP